MEQPNSEQTTRPFPPSTSPTLTLSHATPPEARLHSTVSAVEWKGKLSLEAYLRREDVLHSTAAARDGGFAGWILVDSAAGGREGAVKSREGEEEEEEEGMGAKKGRRGEEEKAGTGERASFSGCETLRKRVLVAKGGVVSEEVGYGIGTVFCPPECRGRGYAGRMLGELAKRLEDGRAGGGTTTKEGTYKTKQASPRTSAFSYLYSDIGKDFYSRFGWKVHPSTHIRLMPSLPPSTDNSNPPPTTSNLKAQPLLADAIPPLCSQDEHILRTHLANHTRNNPNPNLTAVAVLPTPETFTWFHSREDFVARELFGLYPAVKGALITSPSPSPSTGHADGKHLSVAWCIWTKMYYDTHNVLYILRLAVDEEALTQAARSEAAENAAEEEDSRRKRELKVRAIELLFREARKEAKEWDMAYVEIWSPGEETVEAARRLEPNVKVVEREKDSIASLRWHGKEDEEVEWLANEKFGWC